MATANDNGDDNFDIDIYGDGDGDEANPDYSHEADQNVEVAVPEAASTDDARTEREDSSSPSITTDDPFQQPQAPPTAQTASHPKLSPQPHDTKRRESSVEGSVDPGATNALMMSELFWWTTEDDIRGWINNAAYENAIQAITFNEHKVNGKSKGQVYVEFSSAHASTAAKHQIETLSNDQPSARKFSVVFTNNTQNPFKTLPKDAPARGKDTTSRSPSTFPTGPNQSNFRGGRGSYHNRGSYNQNRNFGGTGSGGFNGSGGFQNMAMGNNLGGFNRGAMNGLRGGRGAMTGGMMAMGGMPMGPMVMNPVMANMGFQGGNFNPIMFNQNVGANNMGWNPQGNKRQRYE